MGWASEKHLHKKTIFFGSFRVYIPDVSNKKAACHYFDGAIKCVFMHQ